MKLVGSWVLTILAYIGIALGVIFLLVGENIPGVGADKIEAGSICGVAGFIAGFFGHTLASNYRAENGGALGIYLISFLPFIIPLIALFIIWLILKFIDLMLWIATGKHYLDSIIAWLYQEITGKKIINNTDACEGKNIQTYTVYDHGLERTLYMYDEYKYDPNLNVHFNRFRDDCGDFWRSYDNNETFRRETQAEKGQ